MPAKSPGARREPRPVDAPAAQPAHGLQPEQEEPKGPRISAILIAFNQAAELRRAIEALQQGSAAPEKSPAIEILVVDCGSQDESPQLDAEFPTIQILRLPRHFGATRAMNIAMRTAKAELLFFLSPAVEVQPGTVLGLANRLEADASCAAIAPLLVSPTGEPAPTAYRIPSAEDLSAARLRVVPVDVNEDSVAVEYVRRDALLVRRQFLLGMNYFDERFGEYWADLDLAMQIRRAGKKLRVVPSLKATLHPGDDPLRGLPEAEADRTVGAAEFLGKYSGAFAGFKFRLAAILRALLAFNFKRLSLLMSSSHMGSQAGR